jgi:hypothetical protein
MPDTSTGTDAATWVQSGGLALFAAAVLIEVRALRALMATVRDSLTALLERERMKEDK